MALFRNSNLEERSRKDAFSVIDTDASASGASASTAGTIATSTGTGMDTSRRDQVRGKPPMLRICFVPCHDNGVPSNATIDIEGYCTDVDIDSDDEGDGDFHDNFIVMTKRSHATAHMNKICILPRFYIYIQIHPCQFQFEKIKTERGTLKNGICVQDR